MKFLIACLGTETNTFSSLPTGEQSYRDTAFFDGDATRHPASPFSQPLHIWRALAEAKGHRVAEGLCAFAQPAGRTIRRIYEGYRDRILEQARAAMPLDVVLVNMHGAMVAEGYDDCEGDLLSCLREVVGEEVVLGGELDLHCHITPLMLDAATALIAYKEYPHIDIGERAGELFQLCLDAAEGRTTPVMAAHDCRMISMWRTTDEPMRRFVADLKALEGRDGILAVSFGHGFPWGDVAEVGARTLVVADGDADKAAALAADLASRVWAMREETRPTTVGIDTAIDRALAIDGGPVVLADVSDKEILHVAAPGAIAPDFAAIPYTKLLKPYWPRVEDPWAENGGGGRSGNGMVFDRR